MWWISIIKRECIDSNWFLIWRYHPEIEGGKMETDSQVEQWNSSSRPETELKPTESCKKY